MLAFVGRWLGLHVLLLVVEVVIVVGWFFSLIHTYERLARDSTVLADRHARKDARTLRKWKDSAVSSCRT